ncbi:helix-turn-helix domain-containing protein [Fictibacillus sp. S7]|uniref:helix-turn-helix domain-containing protein n=1 Tax=Fictibacillus sp. S7 TaxID=2212476 RepID=UPI00101360A0|nr:helix-turn-helix domain-containing protein [Fictibacillus sp. S7]RXY99755.1 transcriptional regulator [Fictibacillus sp. S7]
MRKWLVNLRKEKNMTQAQVAAAAFIDRGYYAQIETMKRHPSPEVALKISKVLGFNPANFYSEHFSEPFNITLEDSPVTVAQCDLDLRYTWIFNPPPDFAPFSAIGKRDDELGYYPGSMEFMELKRQVIQTKAPLRKTIPYSLSDGLHTYDIFGKPLFDSKGNIVGAAMICTDLTQILKDNDRDRGEANEKVEN